MVDATSGARIRRCVVRDPDRATRRSSPQALNTIGAGLAGLTLASNRALGASAANTIIDATGEPNGIVVQADGVTVSGFTVQHAGLNGGAGLLDATPYPGTGAYGNTFVRNVVSGNGEGGFQLHSHAPLQDVDGNRVVDNVFGTNNTAGDADSGDMATTAIILFSAVVPVNDTLVTHNSIVHNDIGIWKTANVRASGLTRNRFSDVATNIVTG
jgi:hypothetical protein